MKKEIKKNEATKEEKKEILKEEISINDMKEVGGGSGCATEVQSDFSQDPC